MEGNHLGTKKSVILVTKNILNCHINKDSFQTPLSGMQFSEAYWCHSATDEACAHLPCAPTEWLWPIATAVPYAWLWGSHGNGSLIEHSYKVQTPSQTSGEGGSAAVWHQLQPPSWIAEHHGLMCTHQAQREPIVISNAMFRLQAYRKATRSQCPSVCRGGSTEHNRALALRLTSGYQHLYLCSSSTQSRSIEENSRAQILYKVMC